MRRRAAISVLLLLTAGCAFTPTAYHRDGVAYGVTEGPFRGRWWNYYERGRSFLDGGFYEEARQDLALALKERDQDQRWARTYGLHFTPQYFPNREFGVSLYYLNDFAAAVDALERSYAQQPSARAACYLRLAREAMSQGDTAAPVMELSLPDGLARVARRTIEIAVSAVDDSYISTITVDGRPVDWGTPAPQLQRTVSVAVQPGANLTTVQVTDVAGNVTESPIVFEGDFDGPVVSFSSPVSVPGTVEGVIADPAGIQGITIAGVEATLSAGTDGAAQFHVTLDREHLGTAPRFVATDGLGNMSQGALPVDTLRVAELPSGLMLASAPTLVHLGGNLTALYLGNQLAAVAKVSEPEQGLMVRFTNLEQGQRYLMDEIVVDLEISAEAGIKSLTLNGAPVAVLPDRTRQRVSSRVALPKEGPLEISAVLEDSTGERRETRVTVERALTAVESLANRLSLAVLGNIWEGPNRGVEAEETFVADELSRLLYEQGRFNLLTRQQLPQVLTEQELAAAIGSRNGASPLRELIPAELMLVGLVRRDAGTIEIILQAISPETSQLMGYADVAGIAETKDALRALVADLALRFTQEFPRVQGQIVDTRRGGTLYSDLAKADRIRPRMKCVVFRQGAPILDPATGTELGRPADVLAEGWFDDVTDSLSSVHIGTQTTPDSPAIEVLDFVITK